MEGKLRIAVRTFAPFQWGLQKIWDAFCAETHCPLKLEMVDFDLHPLYDTTLKNNGLANGKWDIAHLNSDWISEAFHGGAVEDLSEYIANNEPEDYPHAWASSLSGLQKFDKAIAGLPFHDGPECLIYRKDLFESDQENKAFKIKHGKPLAVPKTWDELLEVASFFHRPEKNLFGTVFAAYPDGHNTVFDFCLQLWTRGGKLLDAQGKVYINIPAAVEGMKFYRKALQNKKAIHPESLNFDSVKSGLAFANGEIALMVNWFGFAFMNDMCEGSKLQGMVDISNVPCGDGGNSASLNAYWLYVIGAGSQHKQIAYDFIRYATNKKNDKIQTLEGGIGCRKSTWHDSEINGRIPYFKKLESLHNNAHSIPGKQNWPDIATVIDHLVLEVIHTQKNIDNLLADTQNKIDHLENKALK